MSLNEQMILNHKHVSHGQMSLSHRRVIRGMSLREHVIRGMSLNEHVIRGMSLKEHVNHGQMILRLKLKRKLMTF